MFDEILRGKKVTTSPTLIWMASQKSLSRDCPQMSAKEVFKERQGSLKGVVRNLLEGKAGVLRVSFVGKFVLELALLRAKDPGVLVERSGCTLFRSPVCPPRRTPPARALRAHPDPTRAWAPIGRACTPTCPRSAKNFRRGAMDFPCAASRVGKMHHGAGV